LSTPLIVRTAVILDIEVDMTDPANWKPSSVRFASDVTETDLMDAVTNNWSKISAAVDRHFGADTPEVEA
jgi:hypothetical protein